MTKHIVDSVLLERAHSLLCSYCSTLENRAIVKQAISEISAILAQPAADCPHGSDEYCKACYHEATKTPAADCGLEVVGVLCVSRFRNNPAMENVEFHPAADVEQGQHDLVRKSDADARDAMRLERIAELEAQLVGYDKLSRDANRYRWFRWNASESFYGDEIIRLVNDPVSLDSAIDARLNRSKT